MAVETVCVMLLRCVQQAEEIHALNQRINVLHSDVELARCQLLATTDKLAQTNQQLTNVRQACTSLLGTRVISVYTWATSSLG